MLISELINILFSNDTSGRSRIFHVGDILATSGKTAMFIDSENTGKTGMGDTELESVTSTMSTGKFKQKKQVFTRFSVLNVAKFH